MDTSETEPRPGPKDLLIEDVFDRLRAHFPNCIIIAADGETIWKRTNERTWALGAVSRLKIELEEYVRRDAQGR